eukprot:235169-Pyramimonas_sp.AAC.1
MDVRATASKGNLRIPPRSLKHAKGSPWISYEAQWVSKGMLWMRQGFVIHARRNPMDFLRDIM